jgi:hypothetical protein
MPHLPTRRRALCELALLAALTTGGGALAQTGTQTAPAAASPPKPQSAGDVAAVKGDAAAETTNVRRPLAQGGQVFVDDTVTTGAAARLTLQLGRSTRLQLGEAVRLRLDRHLVNAGGSFDLQGGAMLFDRGVSAAKAETTFRSPYGLMVVRGTKFFAGPSKGVFGVFVFSGEVQVSAAGKTVKLTAGFGTDIAQPGAAPTKAARWKPPRITAAMQSVA